MVKAKTSEAICLKLYQVCFFHLRKKTAISNSVCIYIYVPHLCKTAETEYNRRFFPLTGILRRCPSVQQLDPAPVKRASDVRVGSDQAWSLPLGRHRPLCEYLFFSAKDENNKRQMARRINKKTRNTKFVKAVNERKRKGKQNNDTCHTDFFFFFLNTSLFRKQR